MTLQTNIAKIETDINAMNTSKSPIAYDIIKKVKQNLTLVVELVLIERCF